MSNTTTDNTVPVELNNNNSFPSMNILTIATHNVLSMNDPTKQQLLTNLYHINNIDIIALQDTKLSTNLSIRSFNNNLDKNYCAIFDTQSDTNNHNTGVDFILKKKFADRIYHTKGFWGRIIYADL